MSENDQFLNKINNALDKMSDIVDKHALDPEVIAKQLLSVQPIDKHVFNDAYQALKNQESRKTIFPVLSLDRSKIKWDDYLFTLTPNEMHIHPDTKQRVWFKREDYFAPLSDYTDGKQGINGSKLRQAIWLLQQHILEGGSPDIVHGTVMGSPQSPMATAVSRHFGGTATTVLGATKPTTCLKAGMVEMSAWFGSEFNFVGSGYNTVIQPRCLSLLKETKPDAYYLEYGITLDHKKHSPARLAAFHALGGHQVQNIPDHITDLIIPAGSCNSTCSIMTGLAMFPKPNLKNVWLIGIGPNRLRFIEDRLDIIGKELNLPHITSWFRDYRDNPEFRKGKLNTNLLQLFRPGDKTPLPSARFTVHHVDLHSTNWVRYNDLMDYQWGSIELHPRYEGKVMTWVQQNMPELLNENTLFWIVGSKPYVESMKVNCPELGDAPTSVVVNDFIPADKK